MTVSTFLPVSKNDMQKLGWEQPDFILITGDAYVDHPTFGAAVIGRVLEAEGFKVAIMPQPDWKKPQSFSALGRPRLGFLVTSGNIDSMVAHYTASKKRRSDDDYSPNGKAGKRPDRAVTVYCNAVRHAFPDMPIIIGGIEASLRRFAHYDYWDDKVRRSILFDSGADLLVYGMGEKAIIQIAKALNDGYNISQLTYIDGTAYIAREISIEDATNCPSYEDVINDKRIYAEATSMQYKEHDPVRGKTVIQPCEGRFLVQNKPTMPLARAELDRVYGLPFTREVHPMYKGMDIPAIEEVKFSILSSRGCFGGCNFCALAFHQGRIVQSRSADSIVTEAEELTQKIDFKGYIHDVGGPTANFREPACKRQLEHGVCSDRLCLSPQKCGNLKVSHTEYLGLLRRLRKIKGIKKVFIRSGIRYDYLIADKNDEFLKELCQHHVSGQLKVAPEHVADEVLSLMGKPPVTVYNRFAKAFKEMNQRVGKEQYLVPYLMSSHPGSTLKSAIELAVYLRREGIRAQQVQDFYPTPGTISTTMYYTGINPRTMKKVYVPKTYEDKTMQRALLQSWKPENYDIVLKALKIAGRMDLVGSGKDCLIQRRVMGKAPNMQNSRAKNGTGKMQKRR